MSENIKFEEKIRKIEEIVNILDEGELPLEELIEKYEEAMKLSSECRDFLDKAEQRITEIGS